MNPVSIDIKDKLVAEGVGVFAATTGWGIYIGQEPAGSESDGTDTTLTIYDVIGTPDDTLGKVETDDFTIQIRARGAKGGYDDASTKLEEVQGVLNQLKNYITGSTRYASIYRSSTHNFLLRDEQNRPVWTVNYSGLRTTN